MHLRYVLGTVLIIGVFVCGALYMHVTDLHVGTAAALILSGIHPGAAELAVVNYYRELYGTEDAPTYDITYGQIDSDTARDLIVIYTTEAACGSGGCRTALFIQQEDGTFIPLPRFDFAVKTIEPLEGFTMDMRDLRINDDMTYRMVWNGVAYTLESL